MAKTHYIFLHSCAIGIFLFDCRHSKGSRYTSHGAVLHSREPKQESQTMAKVFNILAPGLLRWKTMRMDDIPWVDVVPKLRQIHRISYLNFEKSILTFSACLFPCHLGLGQCFHCHQGGRLPRNILNSSWDAPSQHYTTAYRN